MYAFLIGNQNLFIDRTSKYLSDERIQNLQKIEADIKKKMDIMKEFNPGTVYMEDLIESENTSKYNDDKNDISSNKNKDEPVQRREMHEEEHEMMILNENKIKVESEENLKTPNLETNRNAESNRNLIEHHTNNERSQKFSIKKALTRRTTLPVKNEVLTPIESTSLTFLKLKSFKDLMKYLDLGIFVILLIGYITAQVENEYFYNINSSERVNKSIIINFMIEKNITNTTANASYILNNFTNNPYYNFTKLTAKDVMQYNSVDDIKINLQISEYSNNLRILILVLTIITIPLIFVSRYIEYLREFIYREKLEISFIHTHLFPTFLIEVVFTMIIPYPNLDQYFILTDLGYSVVIPYSSIMASFIIIRFYFMIKLFKHLTNWTSVKSENICEKFVCKADSQFAFKAFQKENPFILLTLIFIVTCVCFGLSLRIFELYYWESRNANYISYSQDWSHLWNSMWCIFVSMSTVGYGDFYPKTQFGRIVIIAACLIGIYFVSMMMVFMTERSILTENELKAFKLITRLKEKKRIRNLQANMIHQSLIMAKHKLNFEKKGIEEKGFHINYNYEKRNILGEIEEIKLKLRIIKSFEIAHTKEQLFDISDRIEHDFKEIKRELDSLKYIKETINGFLDVQIASLLNIRKTCTGLDILKQILKKPSFGQIIPDRISENEESENDFENDKSIEIKRKETNPQRFDSAILQRKEIVYPEDLVMKHFNFIFRKDEGSEKSVDNENTQQVSKSPTKKFIISDQEVA